MTKLKLCKPSELIQSCWYGDSQLDEKFGIGVSMFALADALGYTSDYDKPTFQLFVSNFYRTFPGLTRRRLPTTATHGSWTPTCSVDKNGKMTVESSDAFIPFEDALLICQNVWPSLQKLGRDTERALIELATESKTIEKYQKEAASKIIDSAHLEQRMLEIADRAFHTRAKIKPDVLKRHVNAARENLKGLCACCKTTPILDSGGQRIVGQFQIDHYYARDDSDFDATWPVCRPCNIRLWKDKLFKRESLSAFQSYHDGIKKHRTLDMFPEGK